MQAFPQDFTPQKLCTDEHIYAASLAAQLRKELYEALISANGYGWKRSLNDTCTFWWTHRRGDYVYDIAQELRELGWVVDVSSEFTFKTTTKFTVKIPKVEWDKMIKSSSS
jgi:hypothetical protein